MVLYDDDGNEIPDNSPPYVPTESTREPEAQTPRAPRWSDRDVDADADASGREPRDLVGDPKYYGIDRPGEFPEYPGQTGEDYQRHKDLWREWAQKQQDALANLVTKGAQEGMDADQTLSKYGFRNEKDRGKYAYTLFGNQGLFAQQGAAVDPNMDYDWARGVKTWKAGTDNAGKSIPINDTEWREYRKAQEYRKAGLTGGYGQMRNADLFKQWGINHFAKDPKTGLYWNMRNDSDGNDPNTWSWVDQYGRKVAAPKGATAQELKGGSTPVQGTPGQPNWTNPSGQAGGIPGGSGDPNAPADPEHVRSLGGNFANYDPNNPNPNSEFGFTPSMDAGKDLDTLTQGFGLDRAMSSYQQHEAKRRMLDDYYAAALGKEWNPETRSYEQSALTGFETPEEAAAIQQAQRDPAAPPPDWDPQAYLANNPDVANSAFASDPYAHYLAAGKAEGRSYKAAPSTAPTTQAAAPSTAPAPTTTTASADSSSPFGDLSQYTAAVKPEGGISGTTPSKESKDTATIKPFSETDSGKDPFGGDASNPFGKLETASTGSTEKPKTDTQTIGAEGFGTPEKPAETATGLSTYTPQEPTKQPPIPPPVEPTTSVSPEETPVSMPKFDPDAYLKANPDVAAAGVDPWQHYQDYGKAEGRAFTAMEPTKQPPVIPPTDTAAPAPTTPAPAPAAPVVPSSTTLQHEQRLGFDRYAYLKANPDVAAAGVDPYEHYLKYGKAEIASGKRKPFALTPKDTGRGKLSQAQVIGQKFGGELGQLGAETRREIERAKLEGRVGDIEKIQDKARAAQMQMKAGLQKEATGYFNQADEYKDLPAYQGVLASKTQKEIAQLQDATHRYLGELQNKLGLSQLELNRYLGELQNSTQQQQMQIQKEMGLDDQAFRRLQLIAQMQQFDKTNQYNWAQLGQQQNQYQTGLEGAAYSDERLKTGIQSYKGALDTLKKINPIAYNYRDVPDPEDRSRGLSKDPQVGVSAQKLEKVLPGAVHMTPSGYRKVDYQAIVMTNVNATKELAKSLEDLKHDLSKYRRRKGR
jgi:hypothetical protein